MINVLPFAFSILLPLITTEFSLKTLPFLPNKTAKTFCFPAINLPGIDKVHSPLIILVDEVSFR